MMFEMSLFFEKGEAGLSSLRAMSGMISFLARSLRISWSPVISRQHSLGKSAEQILRGIQMLYAMTEGS